MIGSVHLYCTVITGSELHFNCSVLNRIRRRALDPGVSLGLGVTNYPERSMDRRAEDIDRRQEIRYARL